MRDGFLERLPFRLTPDQAAALSDIESDLFSQQLMSRLLQGDVGCGKTLVALLAAVSVIEAGEQVAMMAPTELLAHQHGENAAGLLEPLGIRVALLSSSVSPPARRLLLQALESAEIQLLIGTHALFSRDVRYRRLGLVVVDEQQRFGVEQRLALLSKAHSPDLLLMTATPIPRTLALTAFGDLDVSTIRTMPPGRKPVKTHLTRQGNEHRVYQRVRAEISRGRQAYFVYPVIESSDQGEWKAAEEMFENLSRRIYPDLRIGLLHSRVPEEDKRRRMAAFAAGDLHILVATSVVEVGVDVPNATCMVVEHAERFGLSALHQLRGRIGRGEFPSYAYLIYGNRLTQDGIRRLKIMMETADGFRIAEEDLSIRGPGELIGLKQAGFFRFRVADIARDTETLFQAREDVHTLLREDPGLLLPENRCVRKVLSECPPFDEALLDGG
jgi:ATP-dependent DNA helicase RecG